MDMKVDWVVPVWNLIIAGVFLVTIVARMAKMETKVDAMWKAFCELPQNERRGRNRHVTSSN